MKKLLTAFIIISLLCAGVLAEGSDLSDTVFVNAKNATVMIAAGDYDKAYALTGVELSRDLQPELFKILDNLPADLTVQTEVSVAWSQDSGWLLAVPLAAPDDDMIPAIVYTLDADGKVTAISAASWRNVELAYNQSYDVIWNMEYNPSYIVLTD